MRTIRLLAGSAVLVASMTGCGADSGKPRTVETMAPPGDVGARSGPHPTVVAEEDAGAWLAFVVESPAEDALPSLELNGAQIPFGEIVREERTDPKALVSTLVPLEPGEHKLVVRYDDGEEDSFRFELGVELLYVSVVFWGLGHDERTTFDTSTERQGFA